MSVEKLPVTSLWDSDIQNIPSLEALGLFMFLNASKKHNRELLIEHFQITNNKYMRLLKYLEKLRYVKIDYINNRIELLTDPQGIHDVK